MRQQRHLLVFTLALLCLSFIVCDAKQYPMQVIVVNRSTYPATDLRINLISEKNQGESHLETTLGEGGNAGISLGEHTEEQLNASFHLQFYGENNQSINPDYDPSSSTFFENGDFLIFSPPDPSVALFLDTTYDPEVYDQKIMGLYAADDGDRDDVILQNGVPVLMGGALPFINMQNLLSENHDNGTYHYEDITEDGQLLVVNVVKQNCFIPDMQELSDCLTAHTLSLSDVDTYELLFAEENGEYSKNLGYPVCIVTYTVGGNEDTRERTVFVMDTGACAYLYGFCMLSDAAVDVSETCQNILPQLSLSNER